MYLLPYCNLIQSIYYIFHDKRLGYQRWHRPSKMATTVCEREIGVADVQPTVFRVLRALPRSPAREREDLGD